MKHSLTEDERGKLAISELGAKVLCLLDQAEASRDMHAARADNAEAWIKRTLKEIRGD